MTTDPTKSLAPESLPPAEKNALAQMLESDLADVSLRELLSMLLSSVGLAERKAYLERVVPDKPNGFYDRSLQLGTIPLDVRVPRTRTGEFRPATLPPLYQRGYSEETQALLLSLLASGRSLHAVKDALQKMGLSSSQQELERVATGLIEELDLRNSRPLDPDLLALFLDGKYVEFRDGDRLRSACIYVIVGLRRDGRKQVLTCLPRPGRENLEDWKAVLRNLLERGLRRVLILVQDDFSGLLPITQSLFPNATFSSVPCTCSVMPKPISPKPMPLSFNSAGGPLNPLGIWKSPTSSSNSSAIVSPKTIPVSSPNYARSASITWPFSITPN